MGIKTVHHTPRIPEFGFYDFWFLLKLKENLRSHLSEDTEKMKEAMTRILDTFTLDYISCDIYEVVGALRK